MVNFGGRYIHRNRHDDIEYQRICSEHMDETMKLFLTKMMMMTIGFLAAVVGPTYAFSIHGTRTTTIDAAVPFTGENSWDEFAVNIVLQSLSATHGTLIYLGGEVIMDIFNSTIRISPRLIQHKLRKLISDNAENRLTPSQLRFAFVDFIKHCNDANAYMKNVSDLLSWRSLVSPIVFFYSIGMSIYCQYEVGYVAGYGLAFMSATQFFYICELGESVSDNEFGDILYSSKWHLLPSDMQNDLMHLINRQQNISGLSIGPFGVDLNREVFKNVTNKIYSFVMFLLSFNR